MAIPRIRVRVVCTLWVTIETLAPTIRFRSVDLPAFGSPISATSPQRVTPRPPAAPAAPPAAACCAARFDAARASARAAVLEPHLDREDRRVVRPLPVEVDIGRRRQPARLRPFLQRGLGVAPDRAHRRDPLAPGAQDQPPRRLEPAVEIDRGDHRLHRVAEQRRLAPPAGQHLRAPHAERAAEVERGRHLGAGLLAHQRVQPRRELALRRRPGPAASSASAMTRPSTRSPRNSSRWLSAPPATSRDGSAPRSAARAARSRARAGPRPRPWPGRASLDRLEEPVGPPGPEGEHRRPGRGEDHPVGAADQVLERHEADAAGASAGSASPSSCRGCRP